MTWNRAGIKLICRFAKSPATAMPFPKNMIVMDANEFENFQLILQRHFAENITGNVSFHSCQISESTILPGLENEIVKGAFGKPLWPEGITGSITHHSGKAFAAVMPLKQGYIGIDFVETWQSILGCWGTR